MLSLASMVWHLNVMCCYRLTASVPVGWHRTPACNPFVYNLYLIKKRRVQWISHKQCITLKPISAILLFQREDMWGEECCINIIFHNQRICLWKFDRFTGTLLISELRCNRNSTPPCHGPGECRLFPQRQWFRLWAESPRHHRQTVPGRNLAAGFKDQHNLGWRLELSLTSVSLHCRVSELPGSVTLLTLHLPPHLWVPAWAVTPYRVPSPRTLQPSGSIHGLLL